MKLFEVQDAYRPIYVIAETWHEALERWQEQIEKENDLKPGTPDYEVPTPSGIRFVCEDGDPRFPTILLPNVARVSGGPAARLRDDGTSAQPALLAGASPTGNAGEAAPHCADAKRPRSNDLSGK